MKSNWLNTVLRASVIALIAGLYAVPALSLAAGHIQPVGKTEEQSSQLILWYDNDNDNNGPNGDPNTNRFTGIMLTNASIDTPVWVHIQVFASSNPIPGNPATAVICAETDFNDFYTPNDTHLYDMSEIFTNDPLNELFAGDFDGTKGFIIVTPIDGPGTRNAIAHQHMFGNSFILDRFNDGLVYKLNAMGRDAVSFPTGNVVADGTVLDGSANGYVLLQPEILAFSFFEFETGPFDNFADLVSIAFRDNYEGVFGYVAEPADAVWTPLIFDEDENPISCDPAPQNCFFDIGLNGDGTVGFVPANEFLSGEQVLCPGNFNFRGWTKIAVSGLEGLENEVAIAGLVNNYVGNNMMQIIIDFAGADWMITQ